jgi:very-short-patch-repair endonuclease
MKNKRFQHKYRENASNLHKAVGDCLRESELFGTQEIYQEYPVNKVNPKYANGRHKFDWVLPTIKLVVECHGQQHYKVVNFGYDTIEEAIDAFRDCKSRDNSKMDAALDAGYTYIVIPYTALKTINDQMIYDQYQLGQQDLIRYNEENAERRRLEKEVEDNVLAKTLAEAKRIKEHEARQRHLSSRVHKEKLKEAREFRKKRYRRLKELKNEPR